MGLDSYIIKCQRENVSNLSEQIIASRREAYKNPMFACDDFILFNGPLTYMDKFNPDIYWRKFNHVTAWFLEKTYGTLPNRFGCRIIEVPQSVLVLLRDNCNQVLNRCVRPTGRVKIDKRYCAKFFPHINVAFSGSPEYDEYFVEEIKTAMNDIDKLLLTSLGQDYCYLFVIDS